MKHSAIYLHESGLFGAGRSFDLHKGACLTWHYELARDGVPFSDWWLSLMDKHHSPMSALSRGNFDQQTQAAITLEGKIIVGTGFRSTADALTSMKYLQDNEGLLKMMISDLPPALRGSFEEVVISPAVPDNYGVLTLSDLPLETNKAYVLTARDVAETAMRVERSFGGANKPDLDALLSSQSNELKEKAALLFLYGFLKKQDYMRVMKSGLPLM